jgi:hypothetical protein
MCCGLDWKGLIGLTIFGIQSEYSCFCDQNSHAEIFVNGWISMSRIFSCCVLFALLSLFGCVASSTTSQQMKPKQSAQSPQLLAQNGSSILSFEDCVMAGYPIMRSLPPQCATPDGRVFMKGKGQISGPGKDAPTPGGGTCKNLCGNGQCEQIVCLAVGCPCAETPMNCPQDCASDLGDGF